MSPAYSKDMAAALAAGEGIDISAGDPVEQDSAQTAREWVEETVESLVELTAPGATRYRAVPVEVSAMQYLGGEINSREILDWVVRRDGRGEHAAEHAGEYLFFPETAASAFVHDWVVIDSDGNIDVVYPEIFRKRFIELDDNVLVFMVPGGLTLKQLVDQIAQAAHV